MRFSDLPPVAIPLVGMLFNVIAFAVVQRKTRRRGIFSTFMGAFMVGLCVEAVLDLLRILEQESVSHEAWVVAFGDTATYVVLSYVLFHFVNVGDASIRIRIIREVRRAGPGATEEFLLRTYGERTIVAQRIERLSNAGIIEKEKDRYVLRSSKVAFVARLIHGLKRFLLRRTSEFD